MGVISTRIPEDLESELKRFMEEENIEKSGALRILLSKGINQWRRERALNLFRESKVTLLKAAEIAGINPWDFAILIKDEGMNWVDPRGILEDIEES